MKPRHRTLPGPGGLAVGSAAAAADRAAAALPDGAARRTLALALRTLDLASVQRHPNAMSQSLALVGRALAALGALETAEGYLDHALHWAGQLPGVDARVDLACELAELCCTLATHERDRADPDPDRAAGAAPRERARGHARQAARLAAAASDAHWEAKALLRAAEVLDRCGEGDHATRLKARAVAVLATPATPAWLAAHGADRDTAPARDEPAPLLAPGSRSIM